MKRALALFVGLGDNDQMESESDAFFFRNDKNTPGVTQLLTLFTRAESWKAGMFCRCLRKLLLYGSACKTYLIPKIHFPLFELGFGG